MAGERFDFKQFSIYQDRCAMKVGTDGVLLGAWSNHKSLPENKSTIRVLDIGTGTGLIALMIAQKLEQQSVDYWIDAIEIDKEAAIQAQENIERSPWREKINVIHTSLEQFKATQKYDLIVSNPPFYNATLKPEDEARAVARHKDSLPLHQITDFAKVFLSEAGELRMIFPSNYDNEVMLSATLSSLHPIGICNVITKEGKPYKRIMTAFALPSHPCHEIKKDTLYIRDKQGEYSTQYLQMVEDFYLSL